MNALFVHGMGRTPLSWLLTVLRFRRAGLGCSTFGYVVTLQSVEAIVSRLMKQITRLAAEGDYVLIGHSLGGVFIRAALARLPNDTRQPRQVFLLGSPIHAARLAVRLQHTLLFRMITRESGQLLASASRMAAIPAPTVPTIGIAGTCGLRGRFSPFGDEPNDGIVAVSEVSAPWLTEQILIEGTHTFLPSNRKVAELMLARIQESPN